MAGQGHVGVNWLKPGTPILSSMEHVQFVMCPRPVDNDSSVIIFMRDEGCSKFFNTSPIAVYFSVVMR